MRNYYAFLYLAAVSNKKMFHRVHRKIHIVHGKYPVVDKMRWWWKSYYHNLFIYLEILLLDVLVKVVVIFLLVAWSTFSNIYVTMIISYYYKAITLMLLPYSVHFMVLSFYGYHGNKQNFSDNLNQISE